MANSHALFVQVCLLLGDVFSLSQATRPTVNNVVLSRALLGQLVLRLAYGEHLVRFRRYDVVAIGFSHGISNLRILADIAIDCTNEPVSELHELAA